MGDAKKVLVVEDDKFLSSAYKAKLTKAGFELQMAGDGEEALQILQSYIPDIILLDLIMPKRDGFSTLEEIKKNEKLKNIPVIITSNLGQKEDIERGMKLGAASYVIKSDLTLDNLITLINAHVLQN